MPMAVADLLPSRYTALAGAIAVTVLAIVAALFEFPLLFRRQHLQAALLLFDIQHFGNELRRALCQRGARAQ
jgi:hypothetical protein